MYFIFFLILRTRMSLGDQKKSYLSLQILSTVSVASVVFFPAYNYGHFIFSDIRLRCFTIVCRNMQSVLYCISPAVNTSVKCKKTKREKSRQSYYCIYKYMLHSIYFLLCHSFGHSNWQFFMETSHPSTVYKELKWCLTFIIFTRNDQKNNSLLLQFFFLHRTLLMRSHQKWFIEIGKEMMPKIVIAWIKVIICRSQRVEHFWIMIVYLFVE